MLPNQALRCLTVLMSNARKIQQFVAFVLTFAFTNAAFAEDFPIETGIIDAFATLKVATYASMAVSVFMGVIVYIYRFKKFGGKFGHVYGMLTALCLTLGLYQINASLILDETAQVCWVITDAADQLIYPCAQGRESLSNLIGLKSLYTTISPRQILETGMAEPIGPIAIAFLIYTSLVLASIGLCRLGQLVVRRMFFG